MDITFKVKGFVGTEERFAVRHWFETWVEAINSGQLDTWQEALADSLSVFDLEEEELSKAGFIKYLTSGRVEVLIPAVVLSAEDETFHLRGDWQVLRDGMVVFNGLFEMIVKQEEGADVKIFGITFFPRLRLG